MVFEFEELDVYNIQKSYEKLLDEAKKDDEIVLDFEKVLKIDLSYIQLLLSLKKYCDKNNKKLIFKNINSNKLKQTIKLFKADELLGIS